MKYTSDKLAQELYNTRVCNIMESVGDKNSAGGRVLGELTYGNLKLTYESYWHSFPQKRVVLEAGNKFLASIAHIDNDKEFKKFWSEAENYVRSIKSDSGTGEASYYSYLNNFDKVKETLVNLVKKYKGKLSIHEYDGAGGRVKPSGKAVVLGRSSTIPDITKAMKDPIVGTTLVVTILSGETLTYTYTDVLEGEASGNAWYLMGTRDRVFDKLMTNTVIAELSEKNPRSTWKEAKLYK